MFFLPRCFLTFAIVFILQQGVAAQCSVILQPVQATRQASQFLLNQQTAMVVENEQLQAGATCLQQILHLVGVLAITQIRLACNLLHTGRYSGGHPLCK